MREHVCAICGEYALLLPAENILRIEPVAPGVSFCDWRSRLRSRPSEMVLDARRLLGVPGPLPPHEGVTLSWRSTDGTRELSFLVDAVEEIVNCHAEDLIDAMLPRRLRSLCEHVVRGTHRRLRLCVKLDVRIPTERVQDRRIFASSLLAMSAEPPPPSLRGEQIQ